MICKMKQDVWLRYQRGVLRERGVATATVDYESLKSLSLATKGSEGSSVRGVAWLDADERLAFDAKEIVRKGGVRSS